MPPILSTFTWSSVFCSLVNPVDVTIKFLKLKVKHCFNSMTSKILDCYITWKRPYTLGMVSPEQVHLFANKSKDILVQQWYICISLNAQNQRLQMDQRQKHPEIKKKISWVFLIFFRTDYGRPMKPFFIEIQNFWS